MMKTSKNFLLIKLLLIILIVNPLSINANELYHQNEYERENRNVKNIIVGSFTGGWSHLRPLLEISKILVERGYNVTLISPGNYTKDKRIKHYSTGQNFDLRKFDDIDRLINEKPPISFDVMSRFFRVAINFYLDYYYVYERVANEVKPDLFLCDFIHNEACYDMAWKLKKPAVTLIGTTMAIMEVPYRSDPLFGCHVNMENKPFLKRLNCFVTPMVKIIWRVRSSISHLNELRAKVGIEPTSYPFERAKKGLILIDSFFGFDAPFELSPIKQDIGPIMSDNYTPLAPETKKFLENHPRTMFVALGTIAYTSTKNNGILLQSFIEATESGVLDGVIWGLSGVKADEIPKKITLSDGKEIDTVDIINNKHPNIQILPYAPQFSILAHENCKVFLSHGGTSSSHEALYNGKPLLVMPIMTDQYGNAEKLEEFAGVSLTLDKTNLSGKEILTKIQQLLSEEKFKINSERMKILARINSKRKYRAADLIEYVIQSHELKEKLNSKVDNTYLNEWISPPSRMGFIKGKYLDVYLALLAIALGSLVIGVFTIYKLASFFIFAKFVKNKSKNE